MRNRKCSKWASLPIIATCLSICLVPLFGASFSGAALQSQQIRTVAGTGTSGLGGDVPSPGSVLTDLNLPRSIDVALDGSIYIADTANGRIQVMNPDGSQTTYAGTGVAGGDGVTGIGGLATEFQLFRPSGVAVDKNGVVYIADSGHDKIYAVGTDGTITLFAGTGVAGNDGNEGVSATGESLKNPYGVAVDENLIVYISDTGNQRIRMVPTTGPAAGMVSTFAGSSAGTPGSNGVDGAAATTWQLNSPFGLDTDKHNNVYIADRGNNRVVKVETGADNGAGGTLDAATLLAGTGSPGHGVTDAPQLATSAALSSPAGVAIDEDLNVYISDTGNNEVHKIDTGGMITRLSGAAIDAEGVDGVALDATLASPRGLAADQHGNLFIANRDHHRIMKILQPDVDPPIVRLDNPVVALSSDASPAEVVTVGIGGSLSVGFDCSDFYTGILFCTATLDGNPVSDGDSIDTSVAGDQVLIVTAVDNAVVANTTSMMVTITVGAFAPACESRVINAEFANASGRRGSVARLYMAIMNRQPDSAGLNYWVEELDSGRLTMNEVAAFFISYAEFRSLYEGADTAGFVELLYLNVMCRESAADSQGAAFWERLLGEGRWSRNRVTMWFAQSPEFKMLTATS